MKIKFLSALALAAVTFGMASCSSEEVAPVNGESTVTLSVTLPDGIQSRNFGDGTTANKLTVMVLDGTTPIAVLPGSTSVYNTEINLTKNIDLKLVNGKTYKVVCWAAAENSPYTFDTDNYTVTADYEGAVTSDEKLDAFFAAQDITVTGNTNETVKLYRPFAQLNIGTDDLAAAKAAGFEASTVTVTVPTYKSLNLLTGAVETGDPTTVTFGAGALPTGETFPKAGYDYLSMNYIMMSTDKRLVDLEFTVNSAKGETRTLPLTAVPVQRNYRTNIYGSLLTNSVNVNVEIVPAFEEPDYGVLATVKVPVVDADGNITYTTVQAVEVKDQASYVTAVNNSRNVLINSDLTVNSGYVSTDGLTSHIVFANNATFKSATSRLSTMTFDTKNSNISISGNGTIEGSSNYNGGMGSCAISVRYGATVNIFDNINVEGGSGSGTATAGGNDCVQVEHGTVNIYGGNFHSGVAADGGPSAVIFLWANGGPSNANIYGGVFDNGEGNGKFLLNIQDADTVKCKFQVYGGIFVGFNPADNDSDGAHTNYVAEGYKSVQITYNGKEAWQVVKIDPVKTQEEFNAAVVEEGATVVLAENLTVTLPQNIANNVTILGLEGSTIDNTIFKHWDTGNDNCIYNKTGLTFKNLNIKENNVDYAGMVRCDNITYVKCTIEGKMFMNGKNILFDGCEFVQKTYEYNMWTYSGNPMTFRNCVFNHKGKCLNVYRDGNFATVHKLVFENCKFNNSGASAKPALNIKTYGGQKHDITLTGCTATGSELYGVESAGTGQITLTVNGETSNP